MNKTVLFELGKCEKVKYQNFAKWLSNCEVDITSDKYCCILSNLNFPLAKVGLYLENSIV